jgi:hypothetical protein
VYPSPELDDEAPDSDADADDAMGDDAQDDTADNTTPSKLHEKVQDVLQLICNADLIEKEVAAMKLDLKRLPLGRLSKAQISQGYGLLERMSKTVTEITTLSKTKVEEETSEPTTTTGRRRSARPRRTTSNAAKRLRILKTELKELSNDFYSLIPHDFGRNLPPLIESMDEIRLKIDLLEVLADLEISHKLQQEKRKASRAKSAGDATEKLHALDAQYAMLHVDMEPLAETDAEFQTIQQYVQTTHAPTHIQYELEIRSVLKIRRHEEDAFAETLASVPNHRVRIHLVSLRSTCLDWVYSPVPSVSI